MFARIASSTGVQGKLWYRLMESTAPSGRNWEWTSAPVNEKEAMELVPEGIPWKTSDLVRLRNEILAYKCRAVPRDDSRKETVIARNRKQ